MANVTHPRSALTEPVLPEVAAVIDAAVEAVKLLEVVAPYHWQTIRLREAFDIAEGPRKEAN